MHIFLKVKMMTGWNRIRKDLKVKITEETEPKKVRFGVFASPKNIRVRRGSCGGEEVEVGRWRWGGGGFLRGGM